MSVRAFCMILLLLPGVTFAGSFPSWVIDVRHGHQVPGGGCVTVSPDECRSNRDRCLEAARVKAEGDLVYIATSPHFISGQETLTEQKIRESIEDLSGGVIQKNRVVDSYLGPDPLSEDHTKQIACVRLRSKVTSLR